MTVTGPSPGRWLWRVLCGKHHRVSGGGRFFGCGETPPKVSMGTAVFWFVGSLARSLSDRGTPTVFEREAFFGCGERRSSVQGWMSIDTPTLIGRENHPMVG